MDKDKFLALIKAMCQEIENNKIYLTKLDADIGDGDHGINMARGFNAINDFVNANSNLSISEIFKNIGEILLSVSAGTSGPLYGITFEAGYDVCLGKDLISLNDLIQILDIGINQIKSFGGANVGDKTMLDAMIPCLESLKTNSKSPKEALHNAYNAAVKGKESVINVKARKGRASYLGERSIGHIDPGCESFCILFKCIYDIC